MGLIFLTGMPGCGKTTVGSIVAQKLQVPFLDLDEEIQRRTGRNIPKIFAEGGESVFRDYESKILLDLCRGTDEVIALGAGALERDENFARISSSGTLVYLRCHLRWLVERNRGTTNRPLLAGSRSDSDLLSKLIELLRRRRSRYLTASIIVNEFRRRTPADMANDVIVELNRYAAR